MSDEGNGATNLGFFLAGLGLGAVLALLFAPQFFCHPASYFALAFSSW